MASPRHTLRRHGKSFYWAARFLPLDQAVDAARLYAFCRYVDDLVDLGVDGGGDPHQVRERLAALRRDLARGASDDPTMADLLTLLAERDIDPQVVDTLLLTLEQDLTPLAIADWEQLLRYAYGVASTVGIAMCRVLEIRDPRALPFAIDLGIAMQLTNIARDVQEDARRQRRYLPEPALSPATILKGQERGRVDRAVDAILAAAQRYYRSADRGMHYIPLRARLGILIAARVYEAIGTKIRRRRALFWRGRGATRPAEKAWHTLRAVTALLCLPRYWSRHRGSPHDAHLHRCLKGLPGADAPTG
ncbi:MAG: phytoene/squalene synthase family protein [Candidatus Competibacterales bacterium]